MLGIIGTSLVSSVFIGCIGYAYSEIVDTFKKNKNNEGYINDETWIDIWCRNNNG